MLCGEDEIILELVYTHEYMDFYKKICKKMLDSSEFLLL